METDAIRVLLIEDSRVDAQAIEACLDESDDVRFQLTRAESLSAGLAALSRGQFDVVLLDLALPESYGEETFRRVYAENAGVPIVVLTGLEGKELALDLVKAGAQDYLAKSWLEPNLLLRTIRYAIERARRRRADEECNQAQQLLHEGEDRYHRLLSTVTNYTYTVWLEDGVPIRTDHSPGCLAVTGYSPADYDADPYLWINMVLPEDRDLVRKHVAKVLAGEDVAPLEHRITHRDRTTRWVRDSIVERRGNGGQLSGYDGVIEDITKSRHVEQKLREKESELLAARRIQERLLPSKPPSTPGFDIAGASYPSEFTGGDYFDYLPMRDGSLGIVVGDVSGHRFASALLMASTQAYLRSLAQMHTSVVEILSMANEILIQEVEDDHFITLFLGRLNLRNRSFSYASAGHVPALIFDACGNVKARLESTGVPLAVIADAEYASGGALTLDDGDIVFVPTDGVTDALSSDNEVFGLQRAVDVVRANPGASAQTLVDKIREAISAFCRRQRPFDDITMVVIKAAASPQVN